MLDHIVLIALYTLTGRLKRGWTGQSSIAPAPARCLLFTSSPASPPSAQPRKNARKLREGAGSGVRVDEMGHCTPSTPRWSSVDRWKAARGNAAALRGPPFHGSAQSQRRDQQGLRRNSDRLPPRGGPIQPPGPYCFSAKWAADFQIKLHVPIPGSCGLSRIALSKYSRLFSNCPERVEASPA